MIMSPWSKKIKIRAPNWMSLKVYLVDVSFLPVYIEIKLKFYTIYYTAQMV